MPEPQLDHSLPLYLGQSYNQTWEGYLIVHSYQLQLMSIADKPIARRNEVDYPDSDGQPMAENTLQFQWIVAVTGSISHIFREDPNVFVAGDLLWYPVEGDNKIRTAPDTLVVFGRPKGHRGSYRQWVEEGIAPQVVFEVLSPGNRIGEMTRKFKFYEQYGVEEYYIIDPDRHELDGWIRTGQGLTTIEKMDGWISPRLGVRFAIVDDAIQLFQPGGQRFLTYDEVAQELQEVMQEVARTRELAEQEKNRAEQERARADQERNRADQERDRADQERDRADQEKNKAELEKARADEEKARADRLASRLRELGEEYQ